MNIPKIEIRHSLQFCKDYLAILNQNKFIGTRENFCLDSNLYEPESGHLHILLALKTIFQKSLNFQRRQ